MGKGIRPEAGWFHRRRIIYSTLVFCATIILYITIDGADTRLYETIVTSAFFLAGTVISAYVFGATYQDVKITSIVDDKEDEDGSE